MCPLKALLSVLESKKLGARHVDAVQQLLPVALDNSIKTMKGIVTGDGAGGRLSFDRGWLGG